MTKYISFKIPVGDELYYRLNNISRMWGEKSYLIRHGLEMAVAEAEKNKAMLDKMTIEVKASKTDPCGGNNCECTTSGDSR